MNFGVVLPNTISYSHPVASYLVNPSHPHPPHPLISPFLRPTVSRLVALEPPYAGLTSIAQPPHLAKSEIMCYSVQIDHRIHSIQFHNPTVTVRPHFLCPASKLYTANPESPLFRLALVLVHFYISLSFQPRNTRYQRHLLASNFAVQAISRPLIFGHLNEHYISPLNLDSGAYQGNAR